MSAVVVKYALDTLYTLAGLQNMNRNMMRETQLRYSNALRLFFITMFQVPTLYCVVVAPLFIHRKIHSVFIRTFMRSSKPRQKANP
jgi:hypothetical protein